MEITGRFEQNREQLVWGPLYQHLHEHARSGDPILLLISPFIGLEALKIFLGSANSDSGIKVVVRWRPTDLVAGVSDLEIFPYLAERNIPLYVNYDIHLKLYVFASNNAFCTSGNLTMRGLGYCEKPNIEVGNFVWLTKEDWSRIYALINSSKQVDGEMYQRYKNYIDSCPKFHQPIPPSDLYGTSKKYTISTLPAMETPIKLAEFYFSQDPTKYTAEEIRCAVHDLVIFSVPAKLNNTELNQCLSDSFRKTPFVIEFIEVLKAEKSLRFGAVNNWIHSKCEDVPLPYRWEIKRNTSILYEWLSFFFQEIIWDIPGKHSQVIYWRDK